MTAMNDGEWNILHDIVTFPPGMEKTAAQIAKIHAGWKEADVQEVIMDLAAHGIVEDEDGNPGFRPTILGRALHDLRERLCRLEGRADD